MSSTCRTLFVVFFVALGENFTLEKSQEHKKINPLSLRKVIITQNKGRRRKKIEAFVLQRKNNSQPRSNKLEEHKKDWGTQKKFNLLYQQNPKIKRRNEIHHKLVLQMPNTICCLLCCLQWQLYVGEDSGTQKNLTFYPVKNHHNTKQRQKMQKN